MKLKLGKIDKLSIVAMLVLLLGILSSFLDFGIVSVFFSVTLPLIFIVNCAIAIYGASRKKYIYLLGIITFLLSYNFFYQCTLNPKLETQNSISILSYNVQAFNEALASNLKQNDFTKIVKFIDSLDTDIVILQESSYKEGRKLKRYPHVFLGYRQNIRKSLLTIYSKFPIVNKGYIDFDDTKNNAIYADIKINKDTIRVYNSHLQSYVIDQDLKSNNYWYSLNNTITKQVEQAELIKNHMSNSNKKVIIGGDFNATPHSRTYRVLRKGLNDSYVSNGNGLGKTYSHFNYPLRLDYFLYDEKIKVVSHKNFNLNLSDHEPIFMSFKIR